MNTFTTLAPFSRAENDRQRARGIARRTLYAESRCASSSSPSVHGVTLTIEEAVRK